MARSTKLISSLTNAAAEPVTLNSTAGNDVLSAPATTTRSPAAPSDTFVFKGATPASATGNDTITDFNVSRILLQLDHSVFGNSVANILASAQTDANGDTTIHGAGAAPPTARSRLTT